MKKREFVLLIILILFCSTHLSAKQPNESTSPCGVKFNSTTWNRQSLITCLESIPTGKLLIEKSKKEKISILIMSQKDYRDYDLYCTNTVLSRKFAFYFPTSRTMIIFKNVLVDSSSPNTIITPLSTALLVLTHELFHALDSHLTDEETTLSDYIFSTYFNPHANDDTDDEPPLEEPLSLYHREWKTSLVTWRVYYEFKQKFKSFREISNQRLFEKWNLNKSIEPYHRYIIESYELDQYRYDDPKWDTLVQLLQNYPNPYHQSDINDFIVGKRNEISPDPYHPIKIGKLALPDLNTIRELE